MAYDKFEGDTVDLSETPNQLDETTLFEVSTFLTSEELEAYHRYNESFGRDKLDPKRVLAKALAVLHEMDRHGEVYQIRDGHLIEFHLGLDGLKN